MTNELQSEICADLHNIGEILKNKREELSYTLEHVSEITRINLSTLQSIEEGNLEDKSGFVFIRGFVRNYAKLLGLESDWMIEALNKEYSGEFKHPASTSTGEPASSTHLSGINKYFILGCSTVIIVVGALIYWNFHHNTTVSSNIETIESIHTDTQTEIQKDQTTAQAPSAKNNEHVEAAVPAAVISPLNLVLVGNQAEWIRLSVDGQPPQEILLNQGEKYEWPGDENYELTMTSGQTATIYLNGEEIEVSKDNADRLFSLKLNKFSLTKINN